MNHLILMICLLASPSSCREERIATQARVDLPTECMSAMVEWALEHPKWRVVRWRCGQREELI